MHRDLPIWMATEVLSFGSVVRLLNDSQQDTRHNVSAFFGMPDEVFLSWLRTLNFARNVCAHQGRLWNRELAYRPRFPKMNKYPDWHKPVTINGGRVFAVLSICRYCLRKVAVGSAWGTRLRELLREYPQIRRASMGFPPDWEQSPVWGEPRDLDSSEWTVRLAQSHDNQMCAVRGFAQYFDGRTADTLHLSTLKFAARRMTTSTGKHLRVPLQVQRRARSNARCPTQPSPPLRTVGDRGG